MNDVQRSTAAAKPANGATTKPKRDRKAMTSLDAASKIAKILTRLPTQAERDHAVHCLSVMVPRVPSDT